MANECYVCKKRVVSGNSISHSNKHSKRTFKPNLQRVKILENGEVKRVKVCTRCLRSDKVERA